MANKLRDVVQQDPVAWMDSDCNIELGYKDWMNDNWVPLYRNSVPEHNEPEAWIDSDCNIELNYKDWMGADWAPLYRN